MLKLSYSQARVLWITRFHEFLHSKIYEMRFQNCQNKVFRHFWVKQFYIFFPLYNNFSLKFTLLRIKNSQKLNKPFQNEQNWNILINPNWCFKLEGGRGRNHQDFEFFPLFMMKKCFQCLSLPAEQEMVSYIGNYSNSRIGMLPVHWKRVHFLSYTWNGCSFSWQVKFMFKPSERRRGTNLLLTIKHKYYTVL